MCNLHQSRETLLVACEEHQPLQGLCELDVQPLVCCHLAAAEVLFVSRWGSVAVMLRREPKDFTSRGLSDDGEPQTGINSFSQIQDQFCGVFAAHRRRRRRRPPGGSRRSSGTAASRSDHTEPHRAHDALLRRLLVTEFPATSSDPPVNRKQENDTQKRAL